MRRESDYKYSTLNPLQLGDSINKRRSPTPNELIQQLRNIPRAGVPVTGEGSRFSKNSTLEKMENLTKQNRPNKKLAMTMNDKGQKVVSLYFMS